MLLAAALAGALAQPLGAVELTLPSNAVETANSQSAPDSHRIALAPFANGVVPSETVEGSVTRSAWQIRAQGITTLQLLAPLRRQLTEDGFEILFECEASICGGFDFRYALPVLAEPAMHVDLYDFRYLSARRGSAPDRMEHVTLLVSRSANAGFIQMTTVTPPGGSSLSARPTGSPVRANAVPAAMPAAPGDAATDLPLAQALMARGHAVLDDLAFATGSSALGEGPFASLADLAAFLLADPARRVALVGHTDAVGSLEANIALSKRRAASVLERLVSAHGVPRGQLSAEGMGYLAPITTNLTAAGREANRRVEAVLLNTK